MVAPPTHTYRTRYCRPFKEPEIDLSYRPARLHSLAASIPRNRFLGSINDYKYGLRRDDLPFPELNIKGSCSRLETSVMGICWIILKGNCHFFSCFLLSCTMYIFILRGFQQLHIISCLIYEYPELGNVEVIRY
jgi:hypothetical protein